MRTLHDPIRLQIAEMLVTATQKAISIEDAFDGLVEPPNSDMGDLAFGCFSLAKNLKKAPVVIAQDLKTVFDSGRAVSDSTPADFHFAKIEAVGPYLNFTLAPATIGRYFLEKLRSTDFFKIALTQDTSRTMVEYSQPNTHKELHVGHMRNACLGDSIVRTLRYAGYEIVAATFPGDSGTHVAKCLWYLKYHNQESLPLKNKGEWLGRIYSRAHLKLEDEEKTPQGEKNKKQLTEILRQIEARQGEFYDLWKETREWSIELMMEAYRWAGIQFDQWYWESEVDRASTDYARELFKQGHLVESNGAIGMHLEEDNLGFCMLIKSDGTGLYATKDLELARRKFRDHHIQKSLYVVDMRQALHFKQVFKVLEKLGFPQAKSCFHLQYNFVELPDGAMSSRKGNIVPLMQLVHRMEDMVRSQYLSRYRDEWSQQEVDLVATQVAQGAIKYGMVKIDNNKKIVFDINEWLKIDGDSGPFIQYSAARINSLCRKLNYSPVEVDWSLLLHPSERKVMQSLLHFHSVVVQAAEHYRPSVICTYLYELSKRFNLFYHECSIGQAETEKLKVARLALAVCVGNVLRTGLGLLGIPTPERM